MYADFFHLKPAYLKTDSLIYKNPKGLKMNEKSVLDFFNLLQISRAFNNS
ncbi:MAG: hypothetical protein PWQ15_619 [Methanobacterium sp.]|jgi:hypothetical protein|nr:hypothetical protein [Methanobacterium sp.]CDG65113.1 hypothetical protein MBMB1_1011 [Methanobacterium sp. MB1]